MRRVLSLGLSLANALLQPLGLRLAKREAPTRSFADFFFHIKHLQQDFATIVDVGVATGTPALYDAFPRAKFYLVEPVAEFAPSLAKLKARLDAEVFAVAAGAEDGEAVFNVHDDLSGSSLLKQVEGPTLDGTPRRVRLARLDSLLPHELKRPVLVKLDTQGAELDALRGLGRQIDSVDMIIVETSLMPFRAGAPEFADVVTFMLERDFVVYDILEGHVRLLDKTLAQVDLVFVRRDHGLRSASGFFDERQLAGYLERYRRFPQRAVGRPAAGQTR
jgi:FkbM family methyltransferase